MRTLILGGALALLAGATLGAEPKRSRLVLPVLGAAPADGPGRYGPKLVFFGGQGNVVPSHGVTPRFLADEWRGIGFRVRDASGTRLVTCAHVAEGRRLNGQALGDDILAFAASGAAFERGTYRRDAPVTLVLVRVSAEVLQVTLVTGKAGPYPDAWRLGTLRTRPSRIFVVPSPYGLEWELGGNSGTVALQGGKAVGVFIGTSVTLGAEPKVHLLFEPL